MELMGGGLQASPEIGVGEIDQRPGSFSKAFPVQVRDAVLGSYVMHVSAGSDHTRALP